MERATSVAKRPSLSTHTTPPVPPTTILTLFHLLPYRVCCITSYPPGTYQLPLRGEVPRDGKRKSAIGCLPGDPLTIRRQWMYGSKETPTDVILDLARRHGVELSHAQAWDVKIAADYQWTVSVLKALENLARQDHVNHTI